MQICTGVRAAQSVLKCAACAAIMARNSLTRAFVSVRNELILVERSFFCSESKGVLKYNKAL